MFKKLLILMCLGFFSGSLLNAEETATAVPKKYKFSICAVFKNERKFLKEWIEYHCLVGVDHFYLYNLGSEDRFSDLLQPYIKKKLVTLIHWPCMDCEDIEDKTWMWALGSQISAYENAIKIKAIHETTWLVVMDINEFLVPLTTNKITDLLEKYKEYPGVTIQTGFFDASKVNALPPRKLVVESVELTHAELNVQKEVVKTIFKPDQTEGFCWPPYLCLFKDDQIAASAAKNELRINRYMNRAKGYLHAGKIREKLHVDNRMLSEAELEELLKEGYEIEDQEYAIKRFIPWLMTKLGYENWGW